MLVAAPSSTPIARVEDVDLHPTAVRVAFTRAPLIDGSDDTEFDAGIADADGVRLVARDARRVAWLGDRLLIGGPGFGGGDVTGAQLCLPGPDAEACGERVLTNPRGEFGEPAVSPDGRRIAVIASAPGGDFLQVYDARTGRLLRRRLLSGDLPGDPAWSPDGRTVALDYLGTIHLVDVRTGLERTLEAGQYALPRSAHNVTLAPPPREVRRFRPV